MAMTELRPSRALKIMDYRNRAEELRIIAAEMVVPDASSMLLRVAQTYDQLADTVQSMHRS
jgi:hypothetical protein